MNLSKKQLLYLALGYIIFNVSLAIKAIGKIYEALKVSWYLPILVLVFILIPMILGYLIGRPNKHNSTSTT